MEVIIMDLNNCADISEMVYMAMHPEEQEEKVVEEKQEIKFDVSFLLYLVPEEHEWILSLS
jgi:hypothetical protein